MPTGTQNKQLPSDATTTDVRNILQGLPHPSASPTPASGVAPAAATTDGKATGAAQFSTLAVVPLAPDAAGQVLSFASAAAIATDAMKTGVAAKLDNQLTALLFAQGTTAKAMSAFTGSVRQFADAFTGDGRYVLIDSTAKDGNGAALLGQLKALGLQGGSSFGAVVSGFIPVAQIGALASTTNLQFARESTFTASAGRVTTQADQAQTDDVARAKYGVTGAGLRVGIISDSFDTTQSTDSQGRPDTAATDIASDDLPKDTRILQDFKGGEDEGRAMGQLVHDIAPGAAIDFATAEYGQAGFANNILKLAAAGDKIIVDDVSYFDELYFQNGIIGQAVNQVAAQGVSYFGSAGNDGTFGYGAAFASGGTQVINGKTYTVMQFAPGQNYLEISPLGGSVLTLQWDQPGASAGGRGSANDLDLFVMDSKGNVLAQSTVNNIGGDPTETLGVPDGDMYHIVVGVAQGSANPGQIKLVAHSALLQPVASNTNNGTLGGHHGASGGMAVGAANFSKTPVYGVDPPVAEYFTANGRQTFLFDDQGNRLAAPQVGNVAFTAVDGGNTTFFGYDSDALGNDQDPDRYPNFSGTSAAAPDAAATAALLLSANAALTNVDIRALLQDSAIDINNSEFPQVDFGKSGLAPGFDDRTGAGLIQADQAVGFAKTGVISNAGSDRLTGTHLNDRINGSELASTISAGAGNDTVNAGSAADTINGGDGNDLLNGNAGNDTLFGDAGDDRLVGGSGNDIVSGGVGNDTLEGGIGNDTLNGGTGSDTAIFQNAKSGESISLSDSGAGTAAGGDGQDTLYNITNVVGSGYADNISGNALDNMIVGGAGADYLSGGVGNDTIDGGTGGEGTYQVTTDRADLVKPATRDIGSQATALILNTSSAGDFDKVLDLDIAGSLTIPHATVEATASGNGNDWYGFDVGAGATGTFDIDHNLLADGGRFDTVINLVDASGKVLASNDDSDSDAGSGSGASLINYTFANAGRYYLQVTEFGQPTIDADAKYELNTSLSSAGVQYTGATAPNFDVVDGGDGTDTASYASATSAVNVQLGKEGQVQDTGGGGRDYLHGIENLSGSASNDFLSGDANANLLNGGAGNDTLQGGEGADTLTGGAGSDVFRYNRVGDSLPTRFDVISDFTHGQDKIDLTAVHQNVADKFNITTQGNDSFVNVDFGGNGTVDLKIELLNTTSVTASDILWTASGKA